MDFKLFLGIFAEKFVDGFCHAGEFGIIIIVDDNNAPVGQFRADEFEEMIRRAKVILDAEK